jgi:hypothetical protein
MAGFNHLFVPGPTNIPETGPAGDEPADGGHARAGSYPDLTLPSCSTDHEGLQATRPAASSSSRPPVPAPGKSAITNTFNPGDRVLMSRFGQFSHLWVDMAERLGLDVDVVDCRVGNRRSARDLCRASRQADKTHRIKAVFVHPQRDRDRRDQRRRAAAALHLTPPSTLHCCSSTASPRSARSTSARRNGASTALSVRLAERLHAAARPRLPLGQPEGP